MALSANDAFAATGGGKRRRRYGRGRRGALSEINVTPLVDVMLVLLIIFMISAPLLTAGVPIELPKTEAGAMQDVPDPITISIRPDGEIHIGETAVPFANLSPRLTAMADDTTRPIYVRADGRASYEMVARVMASLSTSGFSSINLITDTGGPSSGGGAQDESAP
ncbi:biopolymer transporter ExbD [Phenylobacterium sp.]|uniref:ExbD/TolR family protein n=1 Tax=Phenylobacterium sp. TaxID=1871053 RepID=UPI00301D7A1C